MVEDIFSPVVYMNDESCNLEAFCALYIIELIYYEPRILFMDESALERIPEFTNAIFLGYPNGIVKRIANASSTTPMQLFLKHFNKVQANKITESHTLLDFEKKIRNINNLYELIRYCENHQRSPQKASTDSPDSLANCIFWLSDCLSIQTLYDIFAYVADIAICDRNVLSCCKQHILNKFPEAKKYLENLL